MTIEDIDLQISNQIFPINQNSNLIYQLGEHAVIGISPFNSYFTEEKLNNLFAFCLKKFRSINIFIPDQISKFTLQAIGYSEARAKYKTKRQDSYLKNKIVKALEYNNIDLKHSEKILFPLSKLIQSEIYQKIYNHCLEQFEQNESFRQGCLSTAQWVISKNSADYNVTNIEHAVQYFLYELPLFIDSPAIFGVNCSTFIYHDIPDYLKTIYNKNILVSKNQGFTILRIS